DVYTRKVLKTGSSTASQKGASFDLGVAVNGHGGNVGFSNQEFMNSALGKASAKAVTNLVQNLVSLDLPESGRSRSKSLAQTKQNELSNAAMDALRRTPGKVLAIVDKNIMIVSVGTKQGFKPGD